jgi:hypothetical protein
MGNPRSTFAKNERDRNKKARAAAKREKRLTKGEDELDEDALEAATRPAANEPQDVIIEKLRVLHEDYENERIDDEAFETTKAELLAKLTV